ncbi:PQQ-binding-like beta-propeller repeat protein [Nannocystis sp. SCPEA4]|uniref:outer membrane protein assembly factor BamB family protein n=1 Tax=Nannocystis sp. SCPEA4 TaxID=2996787 RepID=UPI00226E2340|nr:PQQ-binding-like beta-propeller repeat protein [Nannocystis sp. SCPEA4]
MGARSGSGGKAAGALVSALVCACWAPPHVAERPLPPAEQPALAPSLTDPPAPQVEPAPTPAPPVHPISHFAPVWRLDDPTAQLVDADAAHVVVRRLVDGGHELALHDIASGRELGRTRLALGDAYARLPSPALVDPRTLIAIGVGGLVGLEVPGLRERWQVAGTRFHDAIGQRRAVGPHVLMQVDTMGVLVRDLATGRERWRRDERSPADAPSVFDGDRVYFHALGHEVIAFAVDDGAERWRQALPGKAWDGRWQLILVGDRLAAVGPETLLFERASGRLVTRYPTGAHPREWHHLAARDGVLFVSSSAGTEALDAATGSPLWAAPAVMGQLAASDDALYGCGPGEFVRVLERASGSEGWRLGVDRCRDPWPGDLPWFRVATGTPLGDLLVTRTSTGLQAYARLAAPPVAAEDATIRGTTAINGRRRGRVEVHVGDRVVRSDARGHFAVTLPAVRGVVAVELRRDEAERRSGRPCGFEARVSVTLDGSRDYAVALDAAADGYECGRACRCD